MIENPFKCELCPRDAMRGDILCFLCSAMFQEVIPSHELRALDAKKGRAIVQQLPRKRPDALETDNLYYRQWFAKHAHLFQDVGAQL